MISVSYRSLLGRCKFIASVKRLRCTARLHKIDTSRKQLRCTDRLQNCVAIASVNRLRCTARLHQIDASRKQLRCTAWLHKIDASRTQLRCTDQLHNDLGKLPLAAWPLQNHCVGKAVEMHSSVAQNRCIAKAVAMYSSVASCVKLSDCVLKRLRRKAASGAIAFEPRLERNHPFANVRRSLRRNHG